MKSKRRRYAKISDSEIITVYTAVITSALKETNPDRPLRAVPGFWLFPPPIAYQS